MIVEPEIMYEIVGPFPTGDEALAWAQDQVKRGYVEEFRVRRLWRPTSTGGLM